MSLPAGRDWDGWTALVLGGGSAAFAVADNLSHLGASVVLVSESDAETGGERAELLGILGVDVRLGRADAGRVDLSAVDVVVLAPTTAEIRVLDALADAAEDRGLPVLGELELAWRLRDPESAPPWLVAAGGADTATTVLALEMMLLAADLSPVLCGGTGLPLTEAVMDPSPYDVVVAALDPYLLERAGGLRAHSAAVLDSSSSVLGRAYEGVEVACVYNLADPGTESMVEDADVTEGARAIGITLGTPGLSMLGLVEEVLADRAFIDDRRTAAAELATLADVASQEPAFLEQVLAAAALARAFGVEPAAVRDGLRSFRP